MNELQFCYWLQGWIELENPSEITHEQLEVIKDHLKEVFKKVTPKRILQQGMSPIEFWYQDDRPQRRTTRPPSRYDDRPPRIC